MLFYLIIILYFFNIFNLSCIEKDMNQWRTEPLIPYIKHNLCNWISWSIVSKAAEKSRRIRASHSPSAMLHWMSFLTINGRHIPTSGDKAKYMYVWIWYFKINIYMLHSISLLVSFVILCNITLLVHFLFISGMSNVHMHIRYFYP